MDVESVRIKFHTNCKQCGERVHKGSYAVKEENSSWYSHRRCVGEPREWESGKLTNREGYTLIEMNNWNEEIIRSTIET